MNVPPAKIKWGSLILLGTLLTVLCGATSYFTIRWATSASKHLEGPMVGHQWLHRELNLTPSEQAAVNAFETPYHDKREQLLTEFNRRISTLAGLLQEEDELTPEVEQAIHHLHEVHGQLQELSIAHYFDMMKVLPPEKRNQLQALAVQALSEPE